MDVLQQPQADLLQVALAGCATCALTSTAENREKTGNRIAARMATIAIYNNPELDKREATFVALLLGVAIT
jgi:selenophosphate synthase